MRSEARYPPVTKQVVPVVLQHVIVVASCHADGAAVEAPACVAHRLRAAWPGVQATGKEGWRVQRRGFRRRWATGAAEEVSTSVIRQQRAAAVAKVGHLIHVSPQAIKGNLPVMWHWNGERVAMGTGSVGGCAAKPACTLHGTWE